MRHFRKALKEIPGGNIKSLDITVTPTAQYLFIRVHKIIVIIHDTLYGH